jgi:hypothetical protein
MTVVRFNKVFFHLNPQFLSKNPRQGRRLTAEHHHNTSTIQQPAKHSSATIAKTNILGSLHLFYEDFNNICKNSPSAKGIETVIDSNILVQQVK